jgi:uncharacterized protein (DUF486 family)
MFCRMTDLFHTRWLPLVLLTFSNVFMTFAWYGHLKVRQAPLWLAILGSWGIAFFEYMLMVPANRWGYNVYSATELKIMQEVINHAGGHHFVRVQRVCRCRPRRETSLESSRRLYLYPCGRAVHLCAETVVTSKTSFTVGMRPCIFCEWQRAFMSS